MTAADIARLDVTQAALEQQIAVLRDSQRRHAALGNEDEVVADGDAIYLLRHPELCSADTDYPNWIPGRAS
ncbi:hypothetical protein ACFVZH_02435 [Streptomyces sp. NPDC059534]|uniref:hypothetical protein n=1 Tax=Streptomyces sp. NPDC059534 TaxID=3346859 RepID=UPI0036C05D38